MDFKNNKKQKQERQNGPKMNQIDRNMSKLDQNWTLKIINNQKQEL